MSVATQTASLEHAYDIRPYVDQQAVDYYDPLQVADCLIDNGDYDGYAHDRTFSEADVFQLALEDAMAIIKKREQLLRAKAPLQMALQAAIRSQRQQKVWENTRYVVSRTPVDQKQKIS